MDLKDYHTFLESAYSKLPKNLQTSSRFEIPKVIIRYETKNTYLINFKDIVEKLIRDPRHFTGIFLKKAGTMGEIRGSQLFMKGLYKEDVLNKLIEQYTKTFVLCSVCNRPDTQILKEAKKSFLKCEACGARVEIKEK